MTRILPFFWAALLSLSESLPGQGKLFDQELVPFFEKHCYECHDEPTSKGGPDLFSIDTNLNLPGTFAEWERIYDRVSRGEMPPEKKPPPDSDSLKEFPNILAMPLAEAHRVRKGTVLRRLNRREHQNTLNDMFGTHVDLVRMLPEDGRSHEFDNIGEALGVSMVQMQRYLEGIQAVIEQTIAMQPAPPEVIKL